MEKQKLSIALLCAIGFFFNFKPSEPFVFPFLVTIKNFTQSQVNDDVFDVWTYSYLVFLAVLGLLAELFAYKLIIFIGALGHLATRLLLLYGVTLLQMQMMQGTFGVATASDIVYYSYVYLLVTRQNYSIATSLTRASVLVGHTTSSLLGQLLLTRASVSMSVLFYVSLASISVGLVLVVLLPNPALKLHQSAQEGTVSRWEQFKRGMRQYGREFKLLGTSPAIIAWSVWVCFGCAADQLVLNYATALFYARDSLVDNNGFVVFGARLLAAVCAMLTAAPIVRNASEMAAGLIACMASLVAGGALLVMAFVPAIAVAYAAYIVFVGVIEFGIALAFARIARALPVERFAMVFAIDTVFSVGLQTLLQIIVGKRVAHLSAEMRFLVYGVWLIAGAVISSVTFVCALRTAKADRCSMPNEAVYVEFKPTAEFSK